MSDLARQSVDAQQFMTHQLTRDLKPSFDELTAASVFGSPEAAWQTLRGMWFEVEVEEQLVTTNAVLAEVSLEGATGQLIAVAIGAVLLDNLRRRVTQRELLGALARVGISPRGLVARRAAHERVSETTNNWRRTVERELLSPPIHTQQSKTLVDLMARTRVALVVGAGGSGKSSVLNQAVGDLLAEGAEVLAFRLDRRGAFGSTRELGAQLGLSTSPVAALQQAADGRDTLLVIDQLDAVSIASGRLSERYDAIADLVQEAAAIETMRVILACRLFDVENDYRIRKLDARNDVKRLTVEPLTDDAVAEAVSRMGLEPGELTASQRELLKLPLNLVLLNSVSDQPGALTFTSRGSLFEAFWQHKEMTSEERRPGTLFNDVLARIANWMSDNQTLSAPVEILLPGDYTRHARVLASEHLIAIENGHVSFFHEAFFDFTFSREWLTRQQSLVEFLCGQEQELFRRAQVRQILELLRERDTDRFRREVEATLNSNRVRFHLKDAVVAVFASIDAPALEDRDLALRLSSRQSSLAGRLMDQLARPNWFGQFYSEGHVDRLLDSDEDALRDRGIDWVSNAPAEHDAEVVGLLSQRQESPSFTSWLLTVAQRVELHNYRQLFELLLLSVRTGKIDAGAHHALWLSAHELADYRPIWAIEMLRAFFVDSPSALAVGEDGRIALLGIHDYGASQMIEKVSQSEPEAFAQTFVPYLLAVMEATQYDPYERGLLRDRHFSLRLKSGRRYDYIDDALYSGAAEALGNWVQRSPEAARSTLQLLAADRHDAAQSLLYRALIAARAEFASWAAELIMQGGNRLEAGYPSNLHWLAREVVEAIAPVISNQVHLQLEDQFRDLPAFYTSPDPHVRLRFFGYNAFEFLSALNPERLTAAGTRRLQEYRRKFNTEFPDPPSGIIVSTVKSPIEGEATGRMNNEQWLRAIAKHDDDKSDGDLGGARELAHLLQVRTAENPLRFAVLAMRFTSETNEAYPGAVLRGFGDSAIPSEAQTAVFDAIRHLMKLRIGDGDRALSWAVRRVYDQAPIDIVEMVLHRALNAPDPVDDTPVFVGHEPHRPGRDLFQNGIKTSRGSLAHSLGDLLISDPDRSRTELVVPHLLDLASDPVLSVRACVAHTVAACLRHARSIAYAAFERLIEADDLLLVSDKLEELMIYIGNADPELIDPVITRMLDSNYSDVRTGGGRMAGFAALQWGRLELVERALRCDVEVRRGLAELCAARVDVSANSGVAHSALRRLMQDEDIGVRKEVSALAIHLRGHSLRPYFDLLTDLIESPSYTYATPQLFLTLQEAPDKVDDLVDLAAHRFLDIHQGAVADIRTGAAGDAHYISGLVVRGLAQTRDRQRIAALLDILDRLLELGVYGVHRAIDGAARR